MAKREDATSTSGNGQQALLELINKYKKVKDEVIRFTIDKLVKTTMKQKDPDNYTMEKALAHAELDKIGERISDRRLRLSVYKGTLLQKTLFCQLTLFPAGR